MPVGFLFGEFNMTVTIKTNHVPRHTIQGYELTTKEREEFDYIPKDEIDGHDFFRFKGQVYDLNEFMRVGAAFGLQGWDGYHSDSAFSGILVKYVNHGDSVIVGTYYS